MLNFHTAIAFMKKHPESVSFTKDYVDGLLKKPIEEDMPEIVRTTIALQYPADRACAYLAMRFGRSKSALMGDFVESVLLDVIYRMGLHDDLEFLKYLAKHDFSTPPGGDE